MDIVRVYQLPRGKTAITIPGLSNYSTPIRQIFKIFIRANKNLLKGAGQSANHFHLPTLSDIVALSVELPDLGA